MVIVLASAAGESLEDKSIRNRREIINFCSASLGSHGVKNIFQSPIPCHCKWQEKTMFII